MEAAWRNRTVLRGGSASGRLAPYRLPGLPSLSRCPQGRAAMLAFSLIELLATLAIVSLLLALALPA